MSTSSTKEQLRAELDRLENDPDYKLFRESVEKLQILANAQMGGQSVPTEVIQNTLDQIKLMQAEIKKGANPREVFERTLAKSTQQSLPQAFSQTTGEAMLAERDMYTAAGDLIKSERDSYKAEQIFEFNAPVFFNESYKEIKRGLDRIMVQVVLLVMTAEEAHELNSDNLFEQFQNPVYRTQLTSLYQKLSESQVDDALQRYGPRPEDWRPFRDRTMTIGEAVTGALRCISGFTKPLTPDFRDIRLLAPEVGEEDARASLRMLRDEGCMVIMDSISMHHPVIQRAYRRSLLDVYSNIPVLRIIPISGDLDWEQDMLNFGDRYPDTEVYKRLNWDPDDSVREANKEPGLKRWIVGNVPEMLHRREYYKQAQANAQAAYKNINGAE
jgi:hypothetical protein